jgi:hypothetical protein
MHKRSCRYFSGALVRELSPSPSPRELTLSPPLCSPLPGLVPRISSPPVSPHDHRRILVQPPPLPAVINDDHDDHDDLFHARDPENTYIPVQRSTLLGPVQTFRNGTLMSAARSNTSSVGLPGYSARRPMVSVPRPIVPASRSMSLSPL